MRPHPVSLLALTVTLALVASAGQVIAAEAPQGPTRAEVKASVLAARARGELKPAGEASQPFLEPAAGEPRTVAQVRGETLAARASGTLVPAGEGAPAYAPTGTQMARAEVKESTRMARANGELVPAGEGIGPHERLARGPARRAETVAVVRRCSRPGSVDFAPGPAPRRSGRRRVRQARHA